ncbi:MAG: hypothetical protein HUK20_05130 [Fibrobacter sp.]|nr:hypothetical protein [Fibrobacter sp.]
MTQSNNNNNNNANSSNPLNNFELGKIYRELNKKNFGKEPDKCHIWSRAKEMAKLGLTEGDADDILRSFYPMATTEEVNKALDWAYENIPMDHDKRAEMEKFRPLLNKLNREEQAKTNQITQPQSSTNQPIIANRNPLTDQQADTIMRKLNMNKGKDQLQGEDLSKDIFRQAGAYMSRINDDQLLKKYLEDLYPQAPSDLVEKAVDWAVDEVVYDEGKRTEFENNYRKLLP